MNKMFDFSKFAWDASLDRAELQRLRKAYQKDVAWHENFLRAIEAGTANVVPPGGFKSKADKNMVVQAWTENLNSFKKRLSEVEKQLAGG